jgi:ABC-type nickel/cobalt efflux system permease component RcnA
MAHCGAGAAAHAVRTHTRLLSLREWAWQRQHSGGAEPARPALGRHSQGRRLHRSGTLLSCGAHDHDHDHAGCNGHAHAHVDLDDVRLNVSASEAQGPPGMPPCARAAREGAARH